MHPEMNHSQSSVPSSLELLADVDILAKSVDEDFVPVSDVVLFKSFDVPSGISLDGLSEGTLVHKLVSDVSARPSDNWWLTALDVIHKHAPHEIEPAACAAEIYLARVAQAHIDAGHAQLDYIEGRDAGMEFIDSSEEETPATVELLEIVKQEGEVIGAPQPATVEDAKASQQLQDTSTELPPTTTQTTGIGGDVVSAEGQQIIVGQLHPGIQGLEDVELQNDGEEIQHDNVMGAAIDGLGLAGDGEITATRTEEDKAKQGLLDDIELIRRKIDEADRLRTLLGKVEALTGEQEAVKRIESHVHPSHPITVEHDDLEMKAGGT